MRLYLGTHEPSWLGRSSAPLFVSLARAERFGRRAALNGWALDSGGFTQCTTRGGWTMPAAEYLDKVYALADRIPGMEWAAPQDWMCEPAALAATGLTVAEHQRRTVDNYAQLHALDTRRLIVPTLQGFAPGEHEQCVDLYAEAGIDLYTEPLIGVGTICRRSGTHEIRGIVERLAGDGLRLHGFGVKTSGLELYAHALISCDSLAWSQRGRKAGYHDRKALCGGSHAACSNCYVWAHQWYQDRLDQIARTSSGKPTTTTTSTSSTATPATSTSTPPTSATGTTINPSVG